MTIITKKKKIQKKKKKHPIIIKLEHYIKNGEDVLFLAVTNSITYSFAITVNIEIHAIWYEHHHVFRHFQRQAHLVTAGRQSPAKRVNIDFKLFIGEKILFSGVEFHENEDKNGAVASPKSVSLYCSRLW